MPTGTRVHRCVDELKGKEGVNPYAVCQASTHQNFHTGKPIKGHKDMPMPTDTAPGKRPPGVPPTMPDADTPPGGIPPAPGAGASPAPGPDEASMNPESGLQGGPLGGGDMGGGEGQMEPYSAQVIRRLHGDAQILLHEYDEMMYHLEHDVIKKHLDTKLRTLVKELEDLEGMMGQHHPGLPALEGGAEGFENYAGKGEEPVEGEGELGEEPETIAGEETGPPDEEGAVTEEEAEEESGGEMPPKKKMASDKAVPADSEEVEEPDEEDAVEGMRTKALRLKYGGKSIDGRTSTGMALKGRAPHNKSVLKSKKKSAISAGKPDEEELADTGAEEGTGGEMPTEHGKPDMNILEHHKKGISNAIKDLGYWAKSQKWDHEDRMKAYHHSEVMNDMAAHYKSLDEDLISHGHSYRRQKGLEEEDTNSTMDGSMGNDQIGGKCITGTEFAKKPDNKLQSKFEGLPENELRSKFSKDLSSDNPESTPEEVLEIEVPARDHPYVEPISNAAKFFKDLSNTAYLQDEHKFEMAKHYEGLDSVLRSATDAVNVQASDEVGSPEVPDTSDAGDGNPGAIGEKSLSDIEKHLEERHSNIVDLNNQIIALYKQFSN